MKRWAILVGLLLLGISADAATNADSRSKPAWRWTLQERLAVRHDPAAAAERVRDARATQVSSGGRIAPNTMPADQADFISGKKHPELLLPWELFDQMMGMAYSTDPEGRSIFRSALNQSVIAGGLPSDFWNRIETISVGYLSDVRQLRELHKRSVTDQAVLQRIAAETSALEKLKCHDRATAIAAARHEFAERFDRFLYEGVAPTMFIAVGHSGESTAAREFEIEGGCQ